MVNVLHVTGATKLYVEDILSKTASAIVEAPTPAIAARAVIEKGPLQQKSVIKCLQEDEMFLQIIDLDSMKLLDNLAVFADDPRAQLQDIKNAIAAIANEYDRCESLLGPLQKVRMDGLGSLEGLRDELNSKLELLRARRTTLENTIEADDAEMERLAMTMLSKDGEDKKNDDDDDVA